MPNLEIVTSLALHLYRAVEKKDLNDVKDLVHRKGANCDVILPNRGISAFHLAVGSDPVSFSKEVTGLFLSSGGNPNGKSEEGLTPVHVASLRGHSENLKLLLSAGGDPSALDEDGYSPLYYAQKEGHLDCVDLLTNNGIGMNRKAQRQPFKEVLQDNGFAKEVLSNRLSDHQELLNILGNVNLVTQSNDKQEAESLVSSMPCSPKEEQSVCVDTLDSVAKLSLMNTEEFVRNERIIDGIEKPNDETFSVSRSFAISNANTYLTYDISDEMVSSPECCHHSDVFDTRSSLFGSNLSYGNFLLSAAPCSSSSPAQRENKGILADHSEEIAFEIENYDGSKLTLDYSIAVEDLSPVTFGRKQLDPNSWGSNALSMSCPEIYDTCTGKEVKHITYRKKWKNLDYMDIFQSSLSGSEEYFTVPEEVYEHTDEDENVILLEKRFQAPVLSVSRTSTLSSLSSCATEELRNELCKVVSCGCKIPVGPITSTTKRAYLRVLNKRKMSDNGYLQPPTVISPKFSRELEEALQNPSKLNHGRYFEVEQKMMLQFDGRGKFSQWQEGNQKSSFNYLLLDPRVTRNLPLRWACNSSPKKHPFSSDSTYYWREFLSAIFYIGKGKRSRPYSHLYEAVTVWRNNDLNENKLSKKLRHILEIWKDNMGVICVHIFQSAIPAEAFTREAAMIDAIGLNNLKNEQRGRYYGLVSSLGFSEKRSFGSFLLHRALVIFLHEGERQMLPAHID